MIRILSIGNSFSQDATRYLHQIAENQGNRIECVNLFVGGCSLQTHWQNWQADAAAYRYEPNGKWEGEHISISKALSQESWDYVTMQQVSELSPDFDTYMPYLSALAEQVRINAPGAKLLIHQTWAYGQGSERLHRELGYADQHDMFRDVRFAYTRAAQTVNAAGILPGGEAMMNAIDMGIGKVHRDGFHADMGIGRYILALAWYMTLTGDMDIHGHIPLDIPAGERELQTAVEAAKMAAKSYRLEKKDVGVY